MFSVKHDYNRLVTRDWERISGKTSHQSPTTCKQPVHNNVINL